jgi:hypothetical protein
VKKLNTLESHPMVLNFSGPFMLMSSSDSGSSLALWNIETNTKKELDIQLKGKPIYHSFSERAVNIS